MNDATAESPATPLDTLGLYCARAVFVAVLVGIFEGIVVSRIADVTAGGIGIATAGLWIPAALLFLFPAAALRRIPSRQIVAVVLALAFGAALFLARATKIAAPLEAVVALTLAYAASSLDLEGFMRRPIAIAGLVLAIVLQLYAAYWVDAHRAFASLLVEHTAVPRFMLRSVLRRFV